MTAPETGWIAAPIELGLLPGGLHPDAAGHRRIGERFGETVFGTAGPFAGRT
jgi:hypothetical protein